MIRDDSRNESGDALNTSWFSRTFSPMKRDSMRSSVFVVLMSAIGLGVFTLHKLMDEVGVVAGIIMVFAYGLGNIMCARFIVSASLKNPESSSMGGLCKHYLGDNYLRLYEIVLFMVMTLVLVAQLLAISELIYTNFGNFIFDLLHVSLEKRTLHNFVFWTVLILGLLLLVICLLDPASKLGVASLVAFAIFIGTSITAIVQAPWYAKENGHDLNIIQFSWAGFLRRNGILLFSFNCNYNFFAVANNMRDSTERRLKKVFDRSFIILMGLFLVLGIIFYVSLGPVFSKTVNLFINRPQIGKSDYFMLVFRTLLTISLLTAFILIVEACKNMTKRLLTVQRTNHIASSILFTLAPTLIAAFFQDVTKVIGIAGSAMCTFSSFTTPCFLALFGNDYQETWKRGFIVGFLCVTLALGVYGSYLNAVGG